MDKERTVPGGSAAQGLAATIRKKSLLTSKQLPRVKRRVVFHNRDIERTEIHQIIGVSRPRERAFYIMMSQTGLRPHTLCKLRKKHIEPDFSSGIIPCCVRVPEEIAKGEFGSYFTFMGEDSVEALKAYFATRPEMTDDSPIFSMYGRREGEPVDRQTFTNIFRRQLEKLKRKEIIDFERKEYGKPAELRLYSLRKWFRKEGGHAGVEYVNFWMGHRADYKAPHIPASDEHYFSRENIEFQRKLYAEKAMPFLRLEAATPLETEKTIAEQTARIEKLEAELKELKALTNLPVFNIPDDLTDKQKLETLTKKSEKRKCNEFCEGHLICPETGKVECSKVVVFKVIELKSGEVIEVPAAVVCFGCGGIHNITQEENNCGKRTSGCPEL